eukprot:4810713-Amphidinium_carterae.1
MSKSRRADSCIVALAASAGSSALTSWGSGDEELSRCLTARRTTAVVTFWRGLFLGRGGRGSSGSCGAASLHALG